MNFDVTKRVYMCINVCVCVIGLEKVHSVAVEEVPLIG